MSTLCNVKIRRRILSHFQHRINIISKLILKQRWSEKLAGIRIVFRGCKSTFQQMLTIFTMGFFGLCSHAPPSKSPKLKIIYQWNFPHRSMYPLFLLFVCFRVWFVSRDVTITSFIWPLLVNHVNWTYNSTSLPKIIWNCLHWSIYVFLVSLCYTWNKKKKQ